MTGWRTIWITRNASGKLVPQIGATGYNGQDLPQPPDAVTRAIGCPDDAMMLDVDQYDDKTGADTLRELEDALGLLPPTWKITSRGPGDPGGKLLYRVPSGTILRGSAGKDVEVIQRHHRWTWAPGTTHPKTSTPVQCYGPDRGPCALPDVASLPMLSKAWTEYLRADDRPMADGNADLPGDDGRCSLAVTWLANRDFTGATPRGERANAAVNYLKRMVAEGHRIGGIIDEVIGALPSTSEADFAGMWMSAPVPADCVELDRECCNDTVWGIDVSTVARAAMNGHAPVSPAGGRLRFRADNQATAGEMLRLELGRGPLAGLYLRDGSLVFTPRVGEDGYIMPAPAEVARGVDHGPAQVRQTDATRLRSLIEVVFDVGRQDAKTGEWSPCLFPPDAARHAIGAAELGIGCPYLMQLGGITHTPVMRPDGSVLSQPGYDAATGLLYLPPAGLTVPPVPERPSAEQVRAAAALLAEPVGLFPFVGEHHRANWLGAMFTPLLRLMLPPPYPMVIITATNAGSGKTLLMRLLGIVHGIATRGEFPRDKGRAAQVVPVHAADHYRAGHRDGQRARHHLQL